MKPKRLAQFGPKYPPAYLIADDILSGFVIYNPFYVTFN